MSWLFSQALVAEYSADTCLDGAPSAQLNVMPTPHKFWRNDKTIEPCDHSRFGLTSRVLTEQHGVALLTSFLVGFHARTSVQPAQGSASMDQEAVSGRIWLASFAKYDQSSSMWKTAQCSLLGDSEKFSETWPRWGSMRNGESFLRRIPALPIYESVSGYWPTPTATLAAHGGRITPSKGREGGTLIEAISARRWPTPTAVTNSGGTAMCKWGGSGSREKLRGMVTPEELNGQLNPEWVEWLMGWPIGWTELRPLAMDKFREWLRQHSPYSRESEAA
jgi:hypothetical protein